MHPSLISLLPSHPAALQSARSQLCLSGPACCGAKLLHMLQHTSPSILPTCQNLHICPSAVLCPSVQCRWMQTGYCCLTVGEFFFMGEYVLEALWFLVCGAGTGSSKGSCCFTALWQRNRGVQALFSVGWSSCAKISWWSLLWISSRSLNSFFTA